MPMMSTRLLFECRPVLVFPIPVIRPLVVQDAASVGLDRTPVRVEPDLARPKHEAFRFIGRRIRA